MNIKKLSGLQKKDMQYLYKIYYSYLFYPSNFAITKENSKHIYFYKKVMIDLLPSPKKG